MVQKSFGLTFTHVSEAPEALVSYFKWFGGQPVGRNTPEWAENAGFDPWLEQLKEVYQSLYIDDFRIAFQLAVTSN